MGFTYEPEFLGCLGSHASTNSCHIKCKTEHPDKQICRTVGQNKDCTWYETPEYKTCLSTCNQCTKNVADGLQVTNHASNAFDCFKECGTGWCPSMCGVRGACCRKGWVGNGCNGKFGSDDRHMCQLADQTMQQTGVNNLHKQCWPEGKNNSNGCGPEGFCCRKGWVGNGCDGTMGSDYNHHKCSLPSGK